MKKDNFLLWTLSGIIGVIIRDFYSFIAKTIGLADFYIWNIGADIFVEKEKLSSITPTILGLITDITIGGMIGVFLGLFLEWRGNKYYLLKGLGTGLFAWLFFFGLFLHNIPQTKAHAPTDSLSSISAFIGHAIFGMSTAFAYIWLLKKRDPARSK